MVAWALRYHIAGAGYTDRDLAEYTRTIPTTFYLRPIPQDQIDGLELSPEAKAAYQNPGY